jgi:hypothetical protein
MASQTLTRPKRKWLLWLVCGLGIGQVLCALALLALVVSVLESRAMFSGSTDPLGYESTGIRYMLAEWPEAGHFPEHIPADAEQVWFYFFRYPFGDGPDRHLQLRLQLPAERVGELWETYEAAAIEHRTASTKATCKPTTDSAECASCTPLPKLRATGRVLREFPEFPPTYDFFFLGEDSGGGNSCWEHGRTWGVAIDRSASQVVYWLSFW